MISAYMDHVLEHGCQPKSVYAFSKQNKFDEAAFYQFFGSFEALEKNIFKAFFDHTFKVLSENEDYQHYDSRNKLLSFYFTFFENLTANRSYVVYALHQHKSNLKTMSTLSELRAAFGKYIDGLKIESFDLRDENLMKAQKAALRNSAWLQLLFTIKFWMDDSSPSFEKTDIFIEKSVNTSFELLNTKPLQSIVDLGKFMFKESMQNKV